MYVLHCLRQPDAVLYLALATLRVDPALLVHLFRHTHKVGPYNIVLDAGQTLLLHVQLLSSLVGLNLCVDLTPAPANWTDSAGRQGVKQAESAGDARLTWAAVSAVHCPRKPSVCTRWQPLWRFTQSQEKLSSGYVVNQ